MLDQSCLNGSVDNSISMSYYSIFVNWLFIKCLELN